MVLKTAADIHFQVLKEKARRANWNELTQPRPPTRRSLEANYVLFLPLILIIYVLINRAKNTVNYGAQDSGRHSLLNAWKKG